MNAILYLKLTTHIIIMEVLYIYLIKYQCSVLLGSGRGEERETSQNNLFEAKAPLNKNNMERAVPDDTRLKIHTCSLSVKRLCFYFISIMIVTAVINPSLDL